MCALMILLPQCSLVTVFVLALDYVNYHVFTCKDIEHYMVYCTSLKEHNHLFFRISLVSIKFMKLQNIGILFIIMFRPW